MEGEMEIISIQIFSTPDLFIVPDGWDAKYSWRSLTVLSMTTEIQDLARGYRSGQDLLFFVC